MRSLFLSLGLVLGATLASAQAIRVGPFLQQATPDGIWVVWETTSGTESTIEWGPTAALGESVVGSSIASEGSARIHQGQITGLEAGTRYFYRVRTGGAQSGIFAFETPDLQSSEASFRFTVYSDMQGNGGAPLKHQEVVNEGMIDFVEANFGPLLETELDFTLVPGDLVSTGTNYDHWKDHFFDESFNLFRHVPVYPVPGNHEQNAHWFFDYFVLPQNGTPGFEEHWYFFDHGNVRIIGLDSNGGYRVQAQLDWLDGVLADASTDPDIDFVFAQLHHPYKSEVWSPGDTAYTGDVVRRLEAFTSATGKPSIHFFGHTHAYERGQSRDHQHLWVNAAAGEEPTQRMRASVPQNARR